MRTTLAVHAALAALVTIASVAVSAPVPAGSQLTISFKYRNNLKRLRGKTAGGYENTNDGYAATIWVEGPYDPGTPCQVSQFQRQNIVLTKTITYFGQAHSRFGDTLRPNPWAYMDYATPDFLAAVLTAGRYYYCQGPNLPIEARSCTTSALLAPTNSRRQDPTRGGRWCDVSSVVCYPLSAVNRPSVGDISRLVDGISGATVFVDSATGATPTNTYTWNMRNQQGALVEEGWYLVYAQMSAERFPRVIEGDTVRNNLAVVNLETCWDNPHYDTLGHHRVVNLFHFKDSAFTKVDTRERKFRGDPYYYLDAAGMTFTYTATTGLRPGLPAGSLAGGAGVTWAPVSGGLVLQLSAGSVPRHQVFVRVLSMDGACMARVKLDALSRRSATVPLARGCYALQVAEGQAAADVPSLAIVR